MEDKVNWPTSTNKLCVKAIKMIITDMIYNAKSGHIGSAFGMAPTAHILFSKFLKCSSSSPDWVNRDRFVLSNGHSSALLYTILHLLNFDITTSDIKKFRCINSRTPGHPEVRKTPGVDASTGPLGQGVANGVGMAIAAKHLAERFNKKDIDLFDHKIFVFCGDGDMMEGVASEACSLAGHLKLDNLILIYDHNKNTIDGPTTLTFTEDVEKRFQSYGWETLRINDGDDDFGEIEETLCSAMNFKGKPRLVVVHNTIGRGCEFEGSSKSHGNCVTGQFLQSIKAENTPMPEEIAAHYEKVREKNCHCFKEWERKLEIYSERYPAEADDFYRIFKENALPFPARAFFREALTIDSAGYGSPSKVTASRSLSKKVLKKLHGLIPELVIGSADLSSSCKVAFKGAKLFSPESPSGRHIAFGVREHAMLAVNNGIASYNLIPVSSTFLNFVTYGFPALRMCAFDRRRHLVVASHDSVALGQDGPSHQPVEVFALLRATPNLILFRPYNMGETLVAYKIALEYKRGPTVISLAKNSLFLQLNSEASLRFAKFGAYVLYESDALCRRDSYWQVPDTPFVAVVLISTGGDVGLAVESAQMLEVWFGIIVRVVSCPSVEIFLRQTVGYRRRVLPLGTLVVSVEAASSFGWSRLAHFSISVDTFGASGSPHSVMANLGFNIVSVVNKCIYFLQKTRLDSLDLSIPVPHVLGVLFCQK